MLRKYQQHACFQSFRYYFAHRYYWQKISETGIYEAFSHCSAQHPIQIAAPKAANGGAKSSFSDSERQQMTWQKTANETSKQCLWRSRKCRFYKAFFQIRYMSGNQEKYIFCRFLREESGIWKFRQIFIVRKVLPEHIIPIV